ncbi:MAG: methyltransferase, partial [Candidatus Omnitrophica bacterium]|nr:methyltransferase [Candidatus Omnitrophota bacterium]
MSKHVLKTGSAGENINVAEASWSFGGDVPKKFSEHVKRSVPYYEDGHQLICKISDFFIRKGSICYDLGVSTGNLTRKLA